MRPFLMAIILVIAGIFSPFASLARAEPVREALLITSVTYTGFPVLPGCARSATLLSAALKAHGFEVTARTDSSIGGIDGAIGAFSRNGAGRAAGFLYVCGYGTQFNDRLFLLPVSATLARPSDVLNQCVLLKSMLNAVAGGAGTTVIALDLATASDPLSTAALEGLASLPLSDATGLIVASHGVETDKPTPLAAALTAGLDAKTVKTAALLTQTRERLMEEKVVVVTARPPAPNAYLAGEAPPPPTPEPTAAPAVATTPPVPPSPSAPPVVTLPDDARMTEADRVVVQTALRRLGYYAMEADGRFGPETRAAIRRYQHEIGVELTGRLTSAQATRLVGKR